MLGRLLRYTRERFPLPGAALYAGSLFLVAFAWGRRLATPEAAGGPVEALVGGAVVLGALLRLRISDEHRDFEHDRLAYPERMLSRGEITLRELGRVALLVAGLEAAAHLLLGPAALLAWLVALAWFGLMVVEFFVPAWLEARIGWYLVTHQLWIPLWAFYAFVCGHGGPWPGDEHLPGLALLLLGTMCGTMTWEIARKTWWPEREHEHAISYTREWGRPRTVLTNQLIAAAAAAALGWLQVDAGGPLGLLLPLPALWLAFLAAGLAFLRRPDRTRAKLVETAGAVHMLGSFVLTGVALLVAG